MTTRAFYRAAALVPFLGLAVAAVVARPSARLPEGWEWVYPTSLTRGVLVYALLAAWLWRQIDRRPAAEMARFIWWVPLIYVALLSGLMLVLALLRGEVGTLLAEQSGAIMRRLAVHLGVGYGYLALVRVAYDGLRNGGRLADAGDSSARTGG